MVIISFTVVFTHVAIEMAMHFTGIAIAIVTKDILSDNCC